MVGVWLADFVTLLHCPPSIQSQLKIWSYPVARLIVMHRVISEKLYKTLAYITTRNPTIKDYIYNRLPKLMIHSPGF